jgi:predicted GTPase
MATEQATDIRAEAILKGLAELQALLQEPITQHALDLNNNAKTAHQHNILNRTHRSLTQYLKLEGDLFYIGLLGHFSTGKSSTINSVLETWGSEVERPTDLNPTDDTISLITRPANEQYLLGVIREGTVPIRSKPIDNQLLDNIVLVDTPGTGDPALVEEIARDFLPICDVILFFFSAASPLDKDDMPLLEELHKRLPFVPIYFVVTRADELRRDMLAPASEDNIDTIKRTRFFDDVIGRLNKLLKPKLYTDEQFLLIDNRYRYNIDAIRGFMRSKCDPTNTRSRLAMHSHKLAYFAKIAKDLRGFFETFLDHKLLEVNRIVHTAEQNRIRYNENVRISNNNLTKTWIDQLTAVNVERERVLSGLTEPDTLPAALEWFELVKRRRQEIAADVLDDAQRTARHVGETLKLKIFGSIAEQIHEYELASFEGLVASGASAADPISLSLPQMDISATMPLVPSRLLTRWANFREIKVSSLRDAAAKLRKIMEDASVLIQAGSPFVECEKIVLAAQTSLTGDLTRFFGSAELYRAGVFTHTTKESIGALGLGKELDALEVELDETDRTKFTSDAINNLFPRFSETTNDARTQVLAMEKKLRPLVTKINDLKIPSPDNNYTLLDNLVATESQLLVQDLFRELRDDVGLFLGALETRLSSIAVERRRAYKWEIADARKRRRFLYGGILMVGAVLGVCTYLGYAHSVEIPQNTFHAVAWNIVAQLIWAPIAFLAAKAIDNFPKRSATIRSDHQAMLRSDLESTAQKETNTYEFASISVPALAKRLDLAYQTVIDYDPDSWTMAAAERLSALRDLHAEFVKTQTECIELVESVTDKVSSYFSDATNNVHLLNAVADKIKAQAIEPSVKLLGDTRESLHRIRQQVHEVEFG